MKIAHRIIVNIASLTLHFHLFNFSGLAQHEFENIQTNSDNRFKEYIPDNPLID